MPTITSKTDTLLPINRIEILISRDRDTKVFVEIVKNVRAIGLKTITVAERPGDNDARFLLVQGGGAKSLTQLGQSPHLHFGGDRMQ